MYGIFTNICPKKHPNACKYLIHWAYGYMKCNAHASPTSPGDVPRSQDFFIASHGTNLGCFKNHNLAMCNGQVSMGYIVGYVHYIIYICYMCIWFIVIQEWKGLSWVYKSLLMDTDWLVNIASDGNFSINVLTKKNDRPLQRGDFARNFLVLKPTSSLEMGHGVSSILSK